MKIWALVDASDAVVTMSLSTNDDDVPPVPSGLELVEAPAGTPLIVTRYDRASGTFS